MTKKIYYIIFFLLAFCISLQSQPRPKIGDLITNSDGSRGIVFWITPDETKGFMVAMRDVSGISGNALRYGVETLIPELPQMNGNDTARAHWQALSDMDGYRNTVYLKAHSDCHPDSAHLACLVDLDNGWFIPSLGLLHQLRANYAFIMSRFTGNGGTIISFGAPYLSSTQHSADSMWVIFQGRVQPQLKTGGGLARAVREFAMPPKQQMVADTTLVYLWSTGDTVTNFIAKPTADTLFTVTATSSVGCASTTSRQIFISRNEPQEIFDTICVGYAYRQNGFDLPSDSNTLAGDFTYQKTLHNGDCEIDLTLHLTKKPSEETTIVDSFCDGKSYILNGVIYASAGDYVQFLTSENGCDSVLNLNLSLKYGMTTTLSADVCEQYIWNNQIYQQSGVYSQTLVAVNGCDSVVTVNLSILKSDFDTVYHSGCDSVYYRGEFYFSSGDRLDTLIGGACGTMRTAFLTVDNSYFSQQNFAGIDSVIYLSNVFYRDTVLLLEHQTVAGCDSVVEVHIAVTPSPIDIDTVDYGTRIHVYWQRVLAVPNPKNLDALRLATYYWYKDDVFLPQSNQSWIEIGNPIPAGRYHVSIHYDGREILFLERIFESPFGVSAYPNPLNMAEELTVEAVGNAIKRVEIFDANGMQHLLPIRITATGYAIGGFRAQGVYVLRMYLEDHSSVETLKIVVR